MAWRRNRQLVSEGFRDLQYLPREKCGWDCTLASLAYSMRRALERRSPDLNAWAARHGAPGSGRYQDLGGDALVLWHGTSRLRADRIAARGLFHKRGLWTTLEPSIAHGYCRRRSERFGTEGAVVCLVLDRSQLVEGRDYELEGNGDILRFQHGLPPDVVEYVLVRDELRFAGAQRVRHPSPWPQARFRRLSGTWVPLQRTPVRYSDSASFSSLQDFIRLCLERLLSELGEITALEAFSTVYAAVSPWEALLHEDTLDLIDAQCVPHRQRGKWQTFRARSSLAALEHPA